MTDTATEIDIVNSPGKQVVADLLKRLTNETTLAQIAAEIALLANLRENLIEYRERNGKSHEESNKVDAIQAIERLPEAASLEDIAEEVQVLIALREAEEDVVAGRLIHHDEIKRRVASWFTNSSGLSKP